jgi:carboxypeptidase Q
MRKLFAGAIATLGVCLLIQAAGPEKIDLGVLHKIKTEAFGTRSKVMDTAFYLTEVYGPRLTGSAASKVAGEWAMKKMGEWGLSNIKMESWPFGRGWSCTHFAAEMKEPEFQPLIGMAAPWTPGTDGQVTGQAVMVQINSQADLEQYKGKLKGKMVLSAPARALQMVNAPYLHRLTDGELADASMAPDPVTGNPSALPLGFTRPPVPGAAASPMGAPGRGGAAGGTPISRTDLNKFLKAEGVAVMVASGSSNVDGGTIMGSGPGSQNAAAEVPPPTVLLTPEHYNRIARLLDRNVPVTLSFDIQAKLTEPVDSFNITAELPGSDPNAGFVMIGGHLDSWTGGTGATDNAAGSAAAMEVMRILKTLDLKLPRTVRIGLWMGEEQGLLGSRAYVREHFADAIDMKPKPEHAKLAGYFNLDNGAGKIRGIYGQDNDELIPIFESWIAPIRDLGVSTVTIRATGSTDHVSFDSVGLPGFQFIQDPLEYGTRTHHSNMDVYDRLQANDLEQIAAVMAWFTYNTATRPEMLPRKPMPAPRGAAAVGGRGGRGE